MPPPSAAVAETLPAPEEMLPKGPTAEPMASSAPAEVPRGQASPQASGGKVICPNCGAEVPPGFKFCGLCGTPIQAPAETAAAPEPAPAPEPTPAAKLVFIRPDGSEGDTVPLNSGSNRIGLEANPAFAHDGYLSPEHGEIVVEPDGFLLRDLGSLNGVFYRITQEEEIQSGDVFRIGQELLRFDEIHEPQPLEDGTELMGSPNPGYWGRLTRIIGYGVDGESYVLKGDRVVVGREHGDIVFPEDGYVSGTHLEIRAGNGRFVLNDLGSSNGTFLKIRGEQKVPSGALVLMGQQLFRLELV